MNNVFHVQTCYLKPKRLVNGGFMTLMGNMKTNVLEAGSRLRWKFVRYIENIFLHINLDMDVVSSLIRTLAS